MEKVKVSGFTVLFTGVGVLLFTLAVAYQLLTSVVNIPPNDNPMDMFGAALAPLITYAIKALFLGIMGWIGSILTRRGVQIVTSVPKEGQETKPQEAK